jgi:hypothetical protein
MKGNEKEIKEKAEYCIIYTHIAYISNTYWRVSSSVDGCYGKAV